MRNRLWAIAIGLAILAPTGAAQAVTGFADRIPPVDRVIRDYSGGTALEARVHQAAACGVMTDAIELLMGPRYYRGEWQAGEKALRESYASCVGNRMPEAGSSTARRQAIVNGYGELERDPRFIAEVRNRYLSAQDITAIERQRTEYDAQLAPGMATSRAQVAAFEAQRTAETQRDEKRKALVFQVLVGCAVALLLGIWGVARGLKPAVLDTSSGSTVLSVAGRSYTLHDTAGIVADLGSETKVTHYPGTDTYDQNGRWISSTSGYSVSNTTQTVFLINKDGAERALQFYNWDIVARPGNEVATVWAIPRGAKRGPYLQFRNLTLDRTLTAHGALDRMFRVRGWFLLSLAIGLAPVAFLLTMFGLRSQGIFIAAIVAVGGVWAVLWLIRKVTRSRARAFARDQLPPILARATQDARAGADRLLAPYQPA